MRASIRENVRYPALVRRSVPERLTVAWSLSLAAIDVLAVLAAAYALGLPPAIGPAACALVIGAMAGCGAYHVSYATVWRDEIYHVLTGAIVALVPLLLLLHVVGNVSMPAAVAVLALASIAMSAVRAGLYVARNGDKTRPYAGAPYITPQAQWRVRRSAYSAFKRAMDVVLAGFGVIVLSPVMLAVAAAIAAESGFPVFFRQERVGRNGTHFRIFKFRTMQLDSGSAWVRPGDKRITRLGAFLRRSSLDELPQLFNVLRGEMSLIGPRPEMVEFAAGFGRTIAHYDERHVVHPGISGWAQTHLKRNLDPSDMPDVLPYDLFYIEHASFVLDTIVIIKTVVELPFHRAV